MNRRREKSREEAAEAAVSGRWSVWRKGGFKREDGWVRVQGLGQMTY